MLKFFTSKVSFLRLMSSSELITYFFRLISSSKFVAYFLFNFWPYPRNRKTLWDSTTIYFRKALLLWTKSGQNILEIGTGDVSILSIYLAKKRKVNLTAVDIIEPYIENAKKQNVIFYY